MPRGGVTVLHVAEKPSVAKIVAGIIANNTQQRRGTADRYSCCWDFQADFPETRSHAKHIFTSVRGHLMEMDFGPGYK